jgi:Ca2+/Na+ antiporter
VADLAGVTRKNTGNKKEYNEQVNVSKMRNVMKKKTAAEFVTDLDAYLAACLKTKCETSCSSLIGGGVLATAVTAAFGVRFTSGCNPATATTTSTPSVAPAASKENSGLIVSKVSAYLIMLLLTLSLIRFKW